MEVGIQEKATLLPNEGQGDDAGGAGRRRRGMRVSGRITASARMKWAGVATGSLKTQDTPVILAHGGDKDWGDPEFRVILGYIINSRSTWVT